MDFDEAKEYVTFTSFEANSKYDCYNECIRNINCSLVQFRNEHEQNNDSINCFLKKYLVNEVDLEVAGLLMNSESMKIARKQIVLDFVSL